MKTLLFLFLCTTAFAQNPMYTVGRSAGQGPTLILCSGAGTNPTHYEVLGHEHGTVGVIVGQMSAGTQVLKIQFDNYKEIESIDVTLYGFGRPQRATVDFTPKNRENAWVGISATPKEYGFWIMVDYKVNFKRA